MEEKSSPAKLPCRYPPTAAGIQVNFCKNPTCQNFGVPPKLVPNKRGGGKSRPKIVYSPGDYINQSGWKVKGVVQPQLKCSLCHEIFPQNSNLAIAEELLRVGAFLDEPKGPSCPSPSCVNHRVSQLTHPKSYQRYGTSAHGVPRFKCKACQRMFTYGGKSTKRQRQTHLNKSLLEHLMNTVPLRRIVKLLDINPRTLYQRIDFLYDQARLFVGQREREWIQKKNQGKRYIAVDRQHLFVNWSNREDRRNTTLMAVGSADIETSYVFAMHLNFDPEMDFEETIKDQLRFGDHHLPQAYRRYARVWLPQDYQAASARQLFVQKAEDLKRVSLGEAIAARYKKAAKRVSIEDEGALSAHSRHPAKGMLVHESVSLYAHMFYLSAMLANAEKVRLFVDQESGIRAAFMSAFHKRVRARTADAFYVAVAKEKTVDEKRGLVSKARSRFNKLAKQNPAWGEEQVQLALVKEEMARMAPIGKWQDKWLEHPCPDMREPEKRVCWLTDLGDYDEDHIARLYLKATLNPIDRFFMQVRRGLTMAERGVKSASSDNRIWYGKNAYNPSVLMKLLEIYRVYFNYCEIGADKKTPAMRLGLARGPVKSEELIYFEPPPEVTA